MRLSTKQLPKQFKGLSKKHSFRLLLIPKEGVRTYNTQWGGGSRNEYWMTTFKGGDKTKYRVATGGFMSYNDDEIIKPNNSDQIVIEGGMFQGAELNPTIYVQPHHLEAFGVTAAQVLFAEPAPAPEQALLNVARCFPLAQLHDYLLDHGSKLAEKTAKYLE